VGLVAENCPHRGASVYFGRNEECGLRCVYHGWKFDVDGNCIDMPNEPAESNFKSKVKITAYPTHESGGIVWAYMGPKETMTPFRDFGSDSLAAEHVHATKLHSTCNWVQTMEGNVDTAHISWLHQWNSIDEIPDDGTDRPGYPSHFTSPRIWRHDRAPRVEVCEEWYGFRYAGLRTTPNGHTNARVTAYVIPYLTMIAAVPYSTRQLWVVPLDDEQCWRYTCVTQPPAADQAGGPRRQQLPNYPYRDRGGTFQAGIRPRLYTAENDYQIDREAQRTLTFTGIEDFVSQDLMVTESMGPIYDRSEEHLGTTDRAVIAMRQILINAAKGLAQGKEPPAVGSDLDHHGIRAAEKTLEPGEDWRRLGTDDDPIVKESELGGVRSG
jgi:phthalate 4,5-dioxygenase oxygenase subunit